MDKDPAATPPVPPALSGEGFPGRVTIIDPVERRPFVPLAHVGRLGISLLAAVCLGDWLLWGHGVGLGCALYTLSLVSLILVNRPGLTWCRRHGVLLVLIALAAVQTAVRPSFSNGLVSWALLLVLAGDTALVALRPLWLRWVRAAFSALGFISKWIAFLRSLGRSLVARSDEPGGRLLRLLSVSWLALALVVIFAFVLGAGNALLLDVFRNGYDWVVSLIGEIRLPGPGRVVFWLVLATATLILLVPRAGKWTDKRCAREIPSFPVVNPLMARTRSVIALAAVNVLFFLTNSLDVAYLWASSSLPAGVTYSEYVHHGVWSLIFAVVLSAIVLTLIFQQDDSVAHARWLKALAMLWVAQNLFLVLGVFLRIMLYVDAYWLTPRRVYVTVFLMLIVAGYGLLIRHILAGRSLKQLLLGNILAVFILFYLIQFVNVPRLVADYNYRQWLDDPAHNIVQEDMLHVLGIEMVPLVIRVAESVEGGSAVQDARLLLSADRRMWRLDLGSGSWQSWTWRRADLYEILAAYEEGKTD